MKQVLLGSVSLWKTFLTVKFVWKSKSCVAPCRGRDLRQFPWEKWIIYVFRCRPCKRSLKIFIPLQTLISESKISLERVKRFIEKSLSTLRSLKTSKATHDSVARVSRGMRRELDFELREPNPKVKASCNVWQILWLTIVRPWEFPHGNE